MSEKRSREERSAERRERNITRHLTNCPHCGQEVLDHMTKCPHCGGELVPKGYRAPDPKKMKIAKIVCYTVFIAAAIGLAVWLIFFR